MRIAPALRRLAGLGLPRHARTFRPLPEHEEAELRRLLERDFFSSSLEYADGTEKCVDMWMHLLGRTDATRTLIVPWLESVRPLNGARILEIGTGTGAATVAFAARGARVTGLEVNEAHLGIASRRCEMHGVDVELVCANASDVKTVFAGRSFDLVVFCASLEHMTLDERLRSIAGGFALLSRDGLCAVIEAPNRLWPFDNHTAMEPFFHWLPPEVAVPLGSQSPRAVFARWCAANHGGGTELARWGRGVSYHEFEIALGRGRFEVVSALDGYWSESVRRRLGRLCSRARRHLEWIEWTRALPTFHGEAGAPAESGARAALDRLLESVRRSRADRACKRVLRSFAGDGVHDAFLGPWLDLVLRPVPLPPGDARPAPRHVAR